MGRVCGTTLTGLVLALGLAGCSHLSPAGYVDGGFRARGTAPPVLLPEIQPRPITVDVGGLPAFADLEAGATRGDGRVGPYRGLGALECLNLAARASTLANLLALKECECRRAPPPRRSATTGGPGPANLRPEILHAASLEARNLSTGQALELFYRLAQAEAKRDVLQSTLAEVGRALNEGKRLEAKGLTIPEGFDELRRRKLDLLESRSELAQGIEQLSAELRNRLNLAPTDGAWHIWPVVDLRVTTPPIDPDLAVREGLARNPELRLYRRLEGPQAAENLRALRSVLVTVAPLLALDCQAPSPSVLTLIRLLCKGPDSDGADLESTRRQWDAYRLDRERTIVKDIRLAALGVNAALEQVVIANERLRDWQAEVDQLQAKGNLGLTVFLERTTANLKRLEASSTLVDKVAALQIAVVKLRQAQFALLE